MTTMSGICLFIITSMMITFTYASAKNITLSLPHTTILSQIGEELLITREAFTCDKPEFTWASLVDNTLSGTVNTLGQKSTLTMKVNTESDGSYRCAVSCDKGEKSFKIVVYSFPVEPILHISSAVVGEQSRITCTFPYVYHSDMMTAEILLDTEIVASYDGVIMGENWETIQNISLSHDIILQEKNDGSKIQCVGEMVFEDSEIEPLKSVTSKDLNLMYPPVKPQIELYPSTTVKSGDKVTVKCSSESRSQVSIQWVKLVDGKELELSFDPQGSLILLSAVPKDSGVYICYAINTVGNTSSQVEIAVQDPPKNTYISITPSPVSEGDSIQITCTSEAFPIPTLVVKVKTEHDLIELQSENGQFNISHAGVEHTGTYICESTNIAGQQSAETTLTVQVPPKNTAMTIVPSPEVREGDTVQIKCTSQASPAPTLVLKKRTGQGLIELQSEHGQYTISHVGVEHSGTYICESANGIGQQTAETTLTVQVPPKNTAMTIVPYPEVREGNTVQIKCTSHGSPAPTLVLKMKKEHDLIQLQSENGQYTISHAGVEHTGTYICESTNIAGQQSAETTLTVQVPPKNTAMTIVPSPEVREGNTVQIKCISHGSPAPALVLKKRTEQGLIELQSEHGQYTISHVGVEHSGTYICESANGIGQQTAETTLTVQVSPKNTNITIMPSPVVTEGDFVWIKCTSEASPVPRLVMKKRMDHGMMELESENGQYNITYAGLEHAGTYVCESRNILGKQVAEITLAVHIPSTSVVMTPSQKATQDTKATINNIIGTVTYPLSFKEKQESPRFNPTAIIIGSVSFVSAASIVGGIIYHARQAKVQGSYNLV